MAPIKRLMIEARISSCRPTLPGLNRGLRRTAGAGGSTSEVHSRQPVLVRLVAVLLLAALASLVPAAHLTPPDQTWVVGFYDSADHDEAVLAITDAVGLLPAGRPVPSVASRLPTRLSCTVALLPDSRPRIALLDRAPPFFS